MAEIIKVSTDEMRQTVSRFTTAQRRLDEAYTHMDRCVSLLDGRWTGPAFLAMQTQWRLMYNNIRQANEKMQDAIDELNATADLFDQNESKITGNFQSLEVGSSPFD